jgi:hypothetical protein
LTCIDDGVLEQEQQVQLLISRIEIPGIQSRIRIELSLLSNAKWMIKTKELKKNKIEQQ